MKTTLPNLASATSATETDNFITATNENLPTTNTLTDTVTSLKLGKKKKKEKKKTNSKTNNSNIKKKERRNSTLDDMSAFLASFNKQNDATRELLNAHATPKTTHASTKNKQGNTKSSGNNSRINSLRNNSSSSSIASPIKRQVNGTQSIADFLASDHHFENSKSRMEPAQSSWIEGLRRMREKKSATNKKKQRDKMTPGSNQTPSSIRDQCPEQAIAKERMRLARRLSTLSFPMKACTAAIEECDGDIEKSVALLLRWYPKGSGSRGAVMNLVKIIVGAESKLKSLRAKLQILYAPSMAGINQGNGDMTGAVRAIFNKYDADGSGSIDHSEFRQMLSDLGVSMTKSEFQEAITMLDNDHNGEVDFEEFLGWWKQNAGNGVVLSDDIDSLFKHVLHEARTIVQADKASLLLVDFETGELWSRITEDDITIRMPLFKGIAGHVVRTGEILNVSDAHLDARFNPEYDRKTGYTTKQILAIPIVGNVNELKRPSSSEGNNNKNNNKNTLKSSSRPNSSGSDGGRSSQSSPESEDFIEMAGSITSKSLGSKLQLDNQNGPLQHKRIIYGVIEVINSHDNLNFSLEDARKLKDLCETIRHGVINVCMMQSQLNNAGDVGELAKKQANKSQARHNHQSESLPVLLPMSPQRRRPSTSPAKSSKYKKMLKSSDYESTSSYGNTSTTRRHTYSSTPSLHANHAGGAATNKLHLGPRLSFADTSSLSKEERLSYMVYKSKQLEQNNKNRGSVVNKMASMLASYDKANGIKKPSPKKKMYQRLGKYLKKGANTQLPIRGRAGLPGL